MEDDKSILAAQKNYASASRRVFASMLDVLLFSIILMPISNILQKLFLSNWNFAEVDTSYASTYGAKTNDPFVFLYYLYEIGYLTKFLEMQLCAVFIGYAYILAWTYSKGTTPGKLLCKLRIIDYKSGDMATFMQVSIRYFFAISTLYIGLFLVEFTKTRRALHDYIAGTAVIKLP